ncbi:MAG: hypothetical protein EA397_09345 [Deltaproteobacteria bacterium]|nr:MAG: hypothetical protein EA397_09345 [Deltaproteobacteria bacterium]
MILRFVSSALLLTSCVIQSERYPRPRDLDPSWLADRPRLLAIQVEPPDLLPGETAEVRALFVDPDDELGTVIWFGCSDEETTSFGCAPDPSVLGGDPTPEDLDAAGVIGIEPGLPPRVTAPEDYLDSLDERSALRGRPYTVTALALPREGLEDDESLDFNQLRVGFKRAMITTRETNQNPGIVRFLVDSHPIEAGQTVLVDPGEIYELDVELAEDAIETYDYLNADGEWEEREEQPFAEWYASGGQVRRATTIHPFLYSRWLAPAASDIEGRWWVVLKDRRGGISWVEVPWRTR